MHSLTNSTSSPSAISNLRAPSGEPSRSSPRPPSAIQKTVTKLAATNPSKTATFDPASRLYRKLQFLNGGRAMPKQPNGQSVIDNDASRLKKWMQTDTLQQLREQVRKDRENELRADR